LIRRPSCETVGAQDPRLATTLTDLAALY